VSSDDAVSLREVAERMDPEKPARRLYGNGPPFDPDRPQAYDPDDLDFPMVNVSNDPWGADPPDSRVVEGSIDAGHLHDKVCYQPLGSSDPIPYLDTVDAPDLFPHGPSGTIAYPGYYADDHDAMYLYNLFWADFNAYDLGMVNRSIRNRSLPEGYTDKGIIESHRWVDPADSDGEVEDWRSMRNVADRHRDGVRHRMLLQNMYLPATRGISDNLTEIQDEYGERFANADFDIVGMCELPAEKQLDRVRDAYAGEGVYSDVDTRYGNKDLGVLLGGQGSDEDETQRNLASGKRNRQYEDAGPAGTGLSKEGWLRVTVDLPGLLGDPKFDLFVTHLQSVFGGRKDRKQQTKISQMRDFADAVERRIDEKPHRPTIAMGDFNIHSQNGGYGDGVDNAQYFSNFMQQMQARGMQDVWLTYGGPGPENTDCNVQPDERTCDPFVSKPGQSYGDYYRGNRLDYVFVEKPRPEHDIHVDVSRVTNVIWQDWRYGTPSLSDHPGVAFDIVTSPTD